MDITRRKIQKSNRLSIYPNKMKKLVTKCNELTKSKCEIRPHYSQNNESQRLKGKYKEKV